MTMRSPNDLSAFAHRNVLIIDDEPSIHHLFTTFLHPEEYADTPDNADGDSGPVYDFKVFNAFNGEYALAICEQQAQCGEPIQIVFVDMRMNGWDGVETIQKLSQADPRLNFVIVTGYPEIAQQQAERRLPPGVPLKVLPKPVKLMEIYQTAYELTEQWHQCHAASHAAGSAS